MVLLLESGADPTIPRDDEVYPLMRMVESGAPAEVLRLAVAKGAKADRLSGGVSTPLHAAAQRSPEMVRALLTDRRADVNARDHLGRTPLMSAVLGENDSDSETARLLLEHGADPGLKDKQGQTALGWAGALGREAAGKVILEFTVLIPREVLEEAVDPRKR